MSCFLGFCLVQTHPSCNGLYGHLGLHGKSSGFKLEESQLGRSLGGVSWWSRAERVLRSLFRKHARELCHAGVTRFASAFMLHPRDNAHHHHMLFILCVSE